MGSFTIIKEKIIAKGSELRLHRVHFADEETRQEGAGLRSRRRLAERSCPRNRCP